MTWTSLKAEIEDVLRRKLIVRIRVELVPPQALPRFEMKTQLIRKLYETSDVKTMTMDGESRGASMPAEPMDPITFTVLRNGLRAMCSQGSALIERVAWGPVITQGRDYSVGVLTGDGRLVAHGMVDITPHMGTFEFSVKAVLEDFGNTISPGDVFIVNDPYRAGTHNQDVRLVRPIFLDGEIYAFAVACAHWSDMGGPIAGTFNPAATEVWAEGIIIPPTLLYHEDKPVKSAFEMIRMNVRVAHERMGDAAAQYQACKLVERRLLEYVERYGKGTVSQGFEALMDYSERLFKAEVAELPGGTYIFTDFCDHDIGRAGHPGGEVHLQADD